MTPDSSRFWDKVKYKVGSLKNSFDKQPIRDWLTESGWVTARPSYDSVIEQHPQPLSQAYERITAKAFS